MKRMVKNGDLLDNKPNGDLGIKGNAQVGGRLQVKSSIIANGEIRGGDISGTKFLLGTEEMPFVKANPAGDATGTLEKIKIGDVAYNVGGGSSDRILILTVPYPKGDTTNYKKTYVDDEIYQKIAELYYETIKVFYNDGNPLGTFHLLNLKDTQNDINCTRYLSLSDQGGTTNDTAWYGSNEYSCFFAVLHCLSDSNGKFVRIYGSQYQSIPKLSKTKFDALYKLADKPTGDGTYVLKATVSGGAVTYTWVAE